MEMAVLCQVREKCTMSASHSVESEKQLVQSSGQSNIPK